MWKYKILSIAFCLLVTLPCKAEIINPYIDDDFLHLGFSIDVPFMSFGITDSNLPIPVEPDNNMAKDENGEDLRPLKGKILYARTSSILPGFNVAFIVDLRLSRHLNLRFTPGLGFVDRGISYAYQNDRNGDYTYRWWDGDHTVDKIHVFSIPISVPIYLKWSAAREKNYRPYILAGGGVSYIVNTVKNESLLLNKWDVFVEGGFGCDIYFPWFKFCPQITYRVGFINQLMNPEDINNDQKVFTTPISKMLNRSLVLTFNIEGWGIRL